MPKYKGLQSAVLGFTLIELLVVIAILGLFSTIVWVNVNKTREKAKLVKNFEQMRQATLGAYLYAEDNNGNFPKDEDPDEAPGFVPQYMAVWPTSACAPDVVFDWENWPGHSATYPDGTPWTPIVRVSLRRKIDDKGVEDDTAIYYLCIQPNQKGECTCNNVNDPDFPDTLNWYCKGYASIQEAPKDITCEDLKSTERFPRSK